jgi:hypothetical protein
MKEWIHRRIRKDSRVYIMPTKMGGYLNGLIFLMFLLSVGYSNNLLLIFTLFLFGLNLMWLVHTHFHMRRLEPQFLNLEDGHAGDLLNLKVLWKKSPMEGLDWKFILENHFEHYTVDRISDSEVESLGQLIVKVRGVKKWSHLKVMTLRPFGLYRTWRFYPLQLTSVVYPPLLKDVSLPSSKDHSLEGENAGVKKGIQDLNVLNPYQGEGLKRVSWKHYARSGELLIKEGLDFQDRIVEFKLELPKTQQEEYLSVLASQMLLCTQKEIPFTFETPSFKRGPSFHRKHLQECLRELAQC